MTNAADTALLATIGLLGAIRSGDVQASALDAAHLARSLDLLATLGEENAERR